MLRKTRSFLLFNNSTFKLVASSSSSSPLGNTNTSSSSSSKNQNTANKSTDSSARDRTQQMLNMRKSPYGIGNKQTLHSHLLTDHSLTVKAAREEAAYRQRALEERGVFDAQAREEAQKIKEEQANTPEGKHHAEIRWVYFVALVGYLFGHIAAHNLFAVEDMRLPYDPVNGFVNDLARQKEMLAKVDDHVHTHVVGKILQTKEQKRLQNNVLHSPM